MTLTESKANNQDNSDIKSRSNEIPIQNIYYMLSYAYNNLKINADILRESVDFNNIYDLFGRILIEAINNLIRRGFYREYIIKTEDTLNIKGKINISHSIKRGTLLHKKLNCQYNEFSDNVLFNQIIKTTLNNLIRINNLDDNIKKNLKKLRPFFQDVNEIDLNRQIFKSLIWNKNNQYYSLPITICELIFIRNLPDDSEEGSIHFKDFIQSYKNEMANLFENFIFNYYKKEFNQFKTHKPKIHWNLDNDYLEEEGRSYLPNMRTDIVLETEDKQLIIDTKFYKKILSSFHEKSMLHSPNLYQIYTYVNNSVFGGEIMGMLLYASLGEDIDYQFKIGGNLILIKTIDLNQSWDGINGRLKEIGNLIL